LDEASIVPISETANSNPAGHQIATWGTAHYDFGSPRKSIEDNDALTTMSGYTSSKFPHKFKKLEEAVKDQIQSR
jgi:hypothetical protein